MLYGTPTLRKATVPFTFGEEWCALSDTCVVPVRCRTARSPSDRYYSQDNDQHKMTNGLARFLKLKLYPHLNNPERVTTGIAVLQKQCDGSSRYISLGFPLQSQLSTPLSTTKKLSDTELECLDACYQAYIVGNYAAAKGQWLRFCNVYGQW